MGVRGFYFGRLHLILEFVILVLIMSLSKDDLAFHCLSNGERNEVSRLGPSVPLFCWWLCLVLFGWMFVVMGY